MSSREIAVQARGLAVSIDGVWVIKDLDLSLARGEFTAIIGPNGAGKTTFLRALAGLEPSWGEIELGGVPIDQLELRTRARAVAYLPQGHLFHWPMPVVDIVALGRMPHTSGFGGLTVADREAIKQAMVDTEILEFSDRHVTSLSGGERARVALARALAVSAPALLADEPGSSLDPRHQLKMLEALCRRAREGVAVIAVLQDISHAARFADRVLVMQDGEFVADGPPQNVMSVDLFQRVF
ncbi:MAG: ABC transporter ATP-binding protein, partial [Alphaproteobacteria bacterium]